MWVTTVVGLLVFGVFGAHALDNGLALTPPMGWLTWERFRCNTDCKNYPDTCISERLIREMALAMVTQGYAEVGYEYVIIDDCWLTHERDENGNLVPDPDRFSSGMRNLSDYVHSLGLKFGIYEDVGTSTCGGYPGSIDHFEQDAQTFADWGVDYVKIDGCNVDAAQFDQLYPALGAALNKTGRPIFYSCEWPLYQTLNGIEPNYTAIAATCNLWRNYYDIDDYYNSFTNILNWHGDNQDKLIAAAGPGGWNDPDMLLVGNFALSYEQSKAQLAAWAVMASPFIMSNDLRKMDEKMKALLQNEGLIRINQDPLGKQGKRVYNSDGIQVWVRTVEPVVDDKPCFAVAVISTRTDGSEFRLAVQLPSIGIDNSDTFFVENIFDYDDSYWQTTKDDFVVHVPPTGAVLYKLRPKIG